MPTHDYDPPDCEALETTVPYIPKLYKGTNKKRLIAIGHIRKVYIQCTLPKLAGAPSEEAEINLDHRAIIPEKRDAILGILSLSRKGIYNEHWVGTPTEKRLGFLPTGGRVDSTLKFVMGKETVEGLFKSGSTLNKQIEVALHLLNQALDKHHELFYAAALDTHLAATMPLVSHTAVNVDEEIELAEITTLYPAQPRIAIDESNYFASTRDNSAAPADNAVKITVAEEVDFYRSQPLSTIEEMEFSVTDLQDVADDVVITVNEQEDVAPTAALSVAEPDVTVPEVVEVKEPAMTGSADDIALSELSDKHLTQSLAACKYDINQLLKRHFCAAVVREKFATLVDDYLKNKNIKVVKESKEEKNIGDAKQTRKEETNIIDALPFADTATIAHAVAVAVSKNPVQDKNEEKASKDKLTDNPERDKWLHFIRAINAELASYGEEDFNHSYSNRMRQAVFYFIMEELEEEQYSISKAFRTPSSELYELCRKALNITSTADVSLLERYNYHSILEAFFNTNIDFACASCKEHLDKIADFTRFSKEMYGKSRRRSTDEYTRMENGELNATLNYLRVAIDVGMGFILAVAIGAASNALIPVAGPSIIGRGIGAWATRYYGYFGGRAATEAVTYVEQSLATTLAKKAAKTVTAPLATLPGGMVYYTLNLPFKVYQLISDAMATGPVKHFNESPEYINMLLSLSDKRFPAEKKAILKNIDLRFPDPVVAAPAEEKANLPQIKMGM